MTDYDEALKLAPDAAEALRQRAFLRQAAGENEHAISDYTALISLLPADGAAFRGRGFAELSLHRYDTAITDFTQAIALDPNDGLAYRFRSKAYVGKGDLVRASRDDDDALRLSAKLPQVSKTQP
jgi:tetratricopeptide (TPR) repeat protein